MAQYRVGRCPDRIGDAASCVLALIPRFVSMIIRPLRPLRMMFVATMICSATTALADEIITYQYDALGRLIATAHSGTVNDQLATQTDYDPAANRTRHQVTGSSNLTATVVIAIPAPNGFQIISIPRD